jgi:ribosome-associated protein
MPPPSSRALALHAARIAWEKDGQDIRVLAFPPGTGLCDFCVLVTGRSERQAHAIADELGRFAKSHGLHRHAVEGESGWMLIDLYDVVLHAFTPEKRKLYALDSLWKQATIIDHEAELKTLAPLADSKRQTGR